MELTNNLEKISIDLCNNLYVLISNIKDIHNNDNKIDNIFILLFQLIFLFKSLLNFCNIFLDNHTKNLNKYNLNVLYIVKFLDNTHYNLLKKYNNLNCNLANSDHITYNKLIPASYYNKTNNTMLSYIINSNININMYNISEITDTIIQSTNNKSPISNIQSDCQIPYEYVNIGFNNMYKLHIYESLEDDIPFNLLVFVKKIDQVVIKIGNEHKYKYINSKIYRTYDIKNKINNDRSILCNNNNKSLNKKCQNGTNCKYYHDIIIGYDDNFHTDRQFSYNPIIYNCITFKDGLYVKENIKKINWIDAINLYQSNLSCILIGCMHSMR